LAVPGSGGGFPETTAIVWILLRIHPHERWASGAALPKTSAAESDSVAIL
jgi:hypothetical protein